MLSMAWRHHLDSIRIIGTQCSSLVLCPYALITTVLDSLQLLANGTANHARNSKYWVSRKKRKKERTARKSKVLGRCLPQRKQYQHCILRLIFLPNCRLRKISPCHVDHRNVLLTWFDWRPLITLSVNMCVQHTIGMTMMTDTARTCQRRLRFV